MARRDLVVIGGSAGGIEALCSLVACLPRGLPAAVLVVVHVPPSATSFLPHILARNGTLPAAHVTHGQPVLSGRIYVAPPNHHVLVHADHLRLSTGPRVNNHRPAIDPTFLSAARWRGARTIGVVLSGLLDDGTEGAIAIRRVGGIVVVQSPVDAIYPSMPENAILHAGADHVLPASAMGALLGTLAGTEVADEPSVELEIDVEEELALRPEEQASTEGRASGFTCPGCHGALWETGQLGVPRYRCRIGHAFGPESLRAAKSEKADESLWTAYRALAESAAFASRLAASARSSGMEELAARYEKQYQDAVARAKRLRAVLGGGDSSGEGDGP